MSKNWIRISAIGLLCCAACDGEGDTETRPYTSRTGQCRRIADGELYLGLMLPYTGEWPKGEAFESGALLALSEINSGGGIHGKRLGAIACDSACNAERGEQVFHELIEDSDLGIIVGPECSSVSERIAPAIKAAKVPVIGPTTTAASLTNLDDDDFYFRASPSVALQGVVEAKYLYSHDRGFGWRTLAILYDETDPWTSGFADSVASAFMADGGVVKRIGYNKNNSDFVQNAFDQIPSDADGVFISGWVEETAALLKLAAISRPTLGWELADGVETEELSASVANYSFTAGKGGVLPRPPSGPSLDHYESAYEAAYGSAPETYSHEYYDSVYLAGMAMQLASDASNGVEVRDALRKTSTGKTVNSGNWQAILSELQSAGQCDYIGASGQLDFDINGDVRGVYRRWSFDSQGKVTLQDVCWDASFNDCQ